MIEPKVKKTMPKDFAVYSGVMLMMLAGVFLYNVNPVIATLFIIILAAYIALKALNVVRKSLLAILFLSFALGMLEIHFGVDKSLPVFWVVGFVIGFIYAALAFIKEFKKMIKGFTSSRIDLEKPESMSYSYDSASGSPNSESSDPAYHADNFGWGITGRGGVNGRGGINPIHKDNDPHGFWL